MYQGGSKENGVIVGRVGGGNLPALELSDAQDMVSAEESLIGVDENGQEVAISAALDPFSGEISWVPAYSLDHVKNKTVAMSQMTSMLRDTDRNNLFENSIQIAIQAFTQRHQRRPVVLDIGCGTGLLSLFAARHGAEIVFAVEMFDTMASIARDVIAANNMSDKIFVINAKSTEIEQLPCEVDLIISELLDSSLLGESCLPSHADAIKRFLRKDDPTVNSITNNNTLGDRIIPNRAEVFATLIDSTEIRSMVRVDSMIAGREPFLVYRNEYAMHCKGGWPMVPIHWEAMEFRGAKKLSDSVPCLQVSFSEIHDSIYMNMMTNPEMMGAQQFPPVSNDQPHHHHHHHHHHHNGPQTFSAAPIKSYDTEIQAKADGTVHGILLWWKTYLLSSSLDPMNSLCYSTEPGVQNWQDHWQQMIYPLPEPMMVKTGDVIKLHLSHDDLTMWVNVSRSIHHSDSNSSSNNSRTIGGKRNREEHAVKTMKSIMPRFYDERIDLKQSCICGWHLLHGVDQILFYNYSLFNKMWDYIFDKLMDPLMHLVLNSSQSLIMDVSDGSVLSITLATKLKKKLLSLGPDQLQLLATSPSFQSLITAAQRLQQPITDELLHQFLFKKIHLISKERKQFSAIFYTQLIEANDLDELITVWDGNMAEIDPIIESISYLNTNEPLNHSDHYNLSHLHSSNASLASEYSGSLVDTNNNPLPLPPVQALPTQYPHNDKNPKINLLISNCFSYQLHCLPLWDAISFYYQKVSLQQLLDVNAIILPCQALIMAMPMELFDLKKCHGLAQNVSGFTHLPLDERQENWHEFLYPYRLANYRKRALSTPAVIGVIDYRANEVKPIHQLTEIAFEINGTCDGVAIWVDYLLAEDQEQQLAVQQPQSIFSHPSQPAQHQQPYPLQHNRLIHYFHNDFPPFMTQSIKFLPIPEPVSIGNRLIAEIYFENGQSEFQHRFEILR